MSDRILMVDDVPEVLGALTRSLGEHHRVVTANGGAQALERCRLEGPFAVVIADYDMPGMKGTELLMRIQDQWPGTVTMLLTGVVEVDVAVDALHNGRIFRFLEKPCPQAVLHMAVRDALAEHHRHSSAREFACELAFARQALTHFNGSLDRLVKQQTESLMRLNRFVGEINLADSLQRIGELTSQAAHELLGGRAVRVELAAVRGGELVCRVATPREPAGELLVESASTCDGELGRLVVEARDANGLELAPLQRSLLTSLASAAAVAATNQIGRRERDEAQHATMLALAKLAEQRDNETGKHIERVSLYCTLIAEGARADGSYRDQISESFVRDLFRAAPLHDIGKVGIPDRILLKPGKLTPEEWEVMKSHAEIGAETLRALVSGGHAPGFLRMGLDIAWCHHERWDGGGYPRGLRGEEIPLAARILALADVYDALTSVRVYKPAWTHAAAIERVAADSGSHFDPTLVASLLKRGDEFDRVRGSMADTELDVPRALRHVAPAA